MRVWIYAMIGLILFIGLAVGIQVYLEKSTASLDQSIQRVETAVGNRQWSRGLEQLKTVKKEWKQTKPKWSLLLHHQEIDNIEQALVKTEAAMKVRHFLTTQIEMASLKDFLNHIPLREKLNWVNVL